MELGRFAPGEEQAILDLFAVSFRRELSRAWWEWRFRNTPPGPGVIVLARENGRLAAHYAVAAIKLSIEGRDVVSGLSGTTMTHPDFRGGGLFPSLARATYAEMVREGMQLVWGFPNSQSHRGFVRDLGWTDIWEIPTFRLRLPLAKPVAAPADVALCTGPLDGFDELWREMRTRHRVIAVRDAAAIEWRYRANPSEQYRILQRVVGGTLRGYAVLKRYKDDLHIVDLLALDDETGVALVHTAISHATAEGATAVSMWLGLHHPLHLELERIGFQNDVPVTYLGARVLDPALTATLGDYRDWYVTMGDSDVY